jgi:peptidoglycan/LPS O-acetylase OafA/YrhL
MGRAKLYEIDIVRAIAIISVLLIHGTSQGTVLPVGSKTQAIYYVINILSSFAVHVFILVSGLVLFYKYFDNWNINQDTKIFYLKRLRQTVFPYILWSFIYYLFIQLSSTHHLSFDVVKFIKMLKWGDAYYHLYFLILIVQLYLVFPLVISLAKRYVFFRKWILLFGVLAQSVFYIYAHWFHPILHKASLFPNYAAVFSLGAFIGIYYDRFVVWNNKHIRWIFPLGVLSGLFLSSMYLLSQFRIYSFENTFYETGLVIYSMSMGVILIWVGRLLVTQVPLGALTKGLLAIGKASFGVYLMHPIFLSLWRNHVQWGNEILAYNLNSLLAVLFCLAASYFVYRLYKRYIPRLPLTPMKKRIPL